MSRCRLIASWPAGDRQSLSFPRLPGRACSDRRTEYEEGSKKARLRGQEEDPGHAGPRKRLADIAWEVMVDPTSVSREVRRNRTALGKVAESRCRIITCDRFEGYEVRGLYGSWCSSRCRNCPDVRRQATCGSLGNSRAARRSDSRTCATVAGCSTDAPRSVTRNRSRDAHQAPTVYDFVTKAAPTARDTSPLSYAVGARLDQKSYAPPQGRQQIVRGRERSRPEIVRPRSEVPNPCSSHVFAHTLLLLNTLLTRTGRTATITNALGDVAQLGERSVRNAEAEGSNPFISTMNSTTRPSCSGLFLFGRS